MYNQIMYLKSYTFFYAIKHKNIKFKYGLGFEHKCNKFYN